MGKSTVRIGLVLLALGWPGPARSEEKPPALEGIVTRVLDAGTLQIQPRGEHPSMTIMLIGLDAPKKATRDREGQEPWGTRAQQFVSLLATRKEVRVEFDVVVPTEDGRARWGYVWLGDKLLNEQVLEAGHAVLATRAPNVRYVERLRAAQTAAREKERGIWNPTEPLLESPAAFVAAQKKQEETGKVAGTLPAFAEGCVIGNSKSKVYHVASGRYYETVKKSEHAVFFRTAADAEKAGYTPSSR